MVARTRCGWKYVSFKRGTSVFARLHERTIGRPFPINLRWKRLFRIRVVAYLAMRMPTSCASCSSLNALSRSQDSTGRVCTYEWRVGGSYRVYAKLYRHVVRDMKGDAPRFSVSAYEEKSTEVSVTINLFTRRKKKDHRSKTIYLKLR